jgi:hypothetical protein
MARHSRGAREPSARHQVEKNEATAHITPFTPFIMGDMPKFATQLAVYQGLQDKGIVTVSTADPVGSAMATADPVGRIMAIKIERAAWERLKKKFAAAQS